MHRRTFLKHGFGAATLTALGVPAGAAMPGLVRRVRPSDAAWPKPAEWARLKEAVGGRLIGVASPLDACRRGAKACAETLEALKNPFYIQDQPGATQTVGWVDAWTSRPSVYAVAAENVEDVIAAVNFAREKHLRLVIKGGGHSYLGQSNAPDSLLLWTRGLNRMEMLPNFVARGGEDLDEPQLAVSVEAGAKFLGLYDFVTTKHGRYVQGGGCTSVGVGGHVQTGGFGSFSKAFGMSAGGLLEAEIVTADGTKRIANRRTNPDLFFALRGGGGSYGVLTKLTLRTQALPERFGFVGQSIRARDDAAFRRLIEMFVGFYARSLMTPHWGEQVSFAADNTMSIAMVSQGLDEAAKRAAWAPFWGWLADNASTYETSAPRVLSIPARRMWDYAYWKTNLPDMIVTDERPRARPGTFWWVGNVSEVGVFLNGYDSIWLPESLVAPTRRAVLARALFDASRHAKVQLHLNKGLAGAPDWVRDEVRSTMAVNPVAADAFTLVIVAAGQHHKHPGLPGHEPDIAAGRKDAARIAAAMKILRGVAPEGGSYCSESDFFNDNWRTDFWGPNYERLLAVKRKYDPTGLFHGHHWVGSELWSKDGFTPAG